MRLIVFIFFLLLLTACGTSMDPFVGLEQAEAQKQYYASQVTATAEARFLGITETAAAWNFAQTQTAYPYTATALSYSPTPVPTATPNAAATLIMANAIAESTKVANEVEISNLHVERARISNTMRVVVTYAGVLVALLLAVMFAVAGAKRLSMVPTPIHDGTGKPLPMMNVVDGTVVDIDRAPNGLIRADKSYLKLLPELTAERQDRVTAMAQAVDMKARSKITSAAVQKLLDSQGVKLLGDGQEQAVAGMDANFPLPSWEIAQGWDGDKGIPYGIHSRGLGLMDLAKTPHIATFGETGSGKSRRFLRPFITFALAAGHRVVILGKQVDFLPFADHPNAFILPIRELTVEGEATKYAMFMKALVDEMNKRDGYLSQVKRSTWGQAGRETTIVVLDEYSNVLDLMPRQQAETTRRYVKGGIREGRKYGFSFVIAAQRAVGMRDEVTNLGRAVFHVADPQESRFAIGMPGAEDLREGYFMAKFGQLYMAGAFEPTDEEISAFLRDRNAPTLEPVQWVDVKALDVEPTAGRLEGGGTEAVEARIQALARDGLSMTAIVRQVWGAGGGDAFYERSELVKKVINSLGAQA